MSGRKIHAETGRALETLTVARGTISEMRVMFHGNDPALAVYARGTY